MFFQDFFFEAVVTVNFTTMLVLTTLFISMSSSLPTTSYINLLFPFILVLLHTFIDSLRTESSNDDGEEARMINHHGTSIPVGGTDIPSEPIANDNLFDRKASLIHRNEAVEVQVR